MLSSDLKAVVAPPARIMTVIWGAMMAATMIYLMIAWLLFGQAGADAVPDAAAGPSALGPVFGVVAFLVVVGSIIFERWWFSGKKIMENLVGSPAYEKINPKPAVAGTEGREVFERMAESEQKLVCLLPYFQTGMIVIWSMREAVAVLGLVLAVMEKDFMVAVPFSVGAALLVAIKMPQPVRFLERVRSLPGLSV